MNVFGAAQCVQDHTGANRGVGDTINQDEGAGGAVVGEGIEGNRRPRRDVADADLVHLKRLGRLVGKVVHVDPVFQVGDGGTGLVGLGAQNVGAAGQQRMLVEPDDVGRELIRDLGPCRRRNQHVAAKPRPHRQARA